MEDAVCALSAELQIDAPKELLYYPTPHAALDAFEEWSPRVGSLLQMYWDYQLPLCDPRSYWRVWGDRSSYVDLGVRRTPNLQRCYAYGEPLRDAAGETLSASVHQQVWAEFESIVPWDWTDALAGVLLEDYQAHFDVLQEQADAEEPTCQAAVHEFLFLGAFRWLVREVAAVDFCHTVLGARRNDRLYGALEALLTHGSLCLTFQNLWVVCDRPVEFQPLAENRLLACYTDGHSVVCRRPGTYVRGISFGT